MPYDLFQHRHNFAAWAAARAVQMPFTPGGVATFKAALERCGVVDFVRNAETAEADKGIFREEHSQWCESIFLFLEKEGLPPKHRRFGRAAKLLAVYLKGMIINGGYHQLPIAAIIYPPIDDILLGNIARQHPEVIRWAWGRLGRDEYYGLVDQLAAFVPGRPLWELEEHWTL